MYSGNMAISIYEYEGNSDGNTNAPAGSDAEASTPPEGWDYVQCGSDSSSRALTEAYFQDPSMNVRMCAEHCAQQGFVFAGIEASTECHCGDQLANGQGRLSPDIECSAPCGGMGQSGQCGGLWKISLFSSLSGDQLASALPLGQESAYFAASDSPSSSSDVTASQTSSQSYGRDAYTNSAIATY